MSNHDLDLKHGPDVTIVSVQNHVSAIHDCALQWGPLSSAFKPNLNYALQTFARVLHHLKMRRLYTFLLNQLAWAHSQSANSLSSITQIKSKVRHICTIESAKRDLRSKCYERTYTKTYLFPIQVAFYVWTIEGANQDNRPCWWLGVVAHRLW